jgi:transcriptional regulator with XRE-family HTH domain
VFWNKLVSLCDKRGISPTKLTEELGIGASNVTRWKAGAAPRKGTVKMIADYFKVPVQSLITDKEITETIFPHPTTGEVIHEAALDFGIGALHQ